MKTASQIYFNPEHSHAIQALKFILDHPAKRPTYPDFPFTVQRDFSEEVEIAIEVKEYRPSGNNRYLDHRDPSFDPGYVEFGDAYRIDKDGKPTPITLTQLELEAAEEQFWG